MLLLRQLSDSFLSRANWWLGWLAIVGTSLGLVSAASTQIIRREISRRQSEKDVANEHRLSIAEQKLVDARQSADAARALADKLETQQRPRHLSDVQRAYLTRGLQGCPKGRVILTAIKMDTEATDFAEEIGQCLSDAGFDVQRYSGPLLLRMAPGVWIGIRSLKEQPKCAGCVQRALQNVGIDCVALLDDTIDGNTLTLGVGQKK